MSSEQIDAPKAAEGAPPQQVLPSRPAKQPKEKTAKGGKNAGLEVRGLKKAGHPLVGAELGEEDQAQNGIGSRKES